MSTWPDAFAALRSLRPLRAVTVAVLCCGAAVGVGAGVGVAVVRPSASSVAVKTYSLATKPVRSPSATGSMPSTGVPVTRSIVPCGSVMMTPAVRDALVRRLRPPSGSTIAVMVSVTGAGVACGAGVLSVSAWLKRM